MSLIGCLVVWIVLCALPWSAHAQDIVVNDMIDTNDAAPDQCRITADAVTISGGIAIAQMTPQDGDVIFVCPGVYNEEVNVGTSVTLNGPYSGTAFDGQSSDRGGEAIIQPPDDAGAAVHIGADNVTIDGFMLDGDSGSDGTRDVFFGVNNFDTGSGQYETVTGFTLTNSIVKDFQAYGIFICNGTRNCTGTRSDAQTGLTTGGAVTNNRFEGIGGLSNADGDAFDFPGRAISMETDGIIETVTGNVIRTTRPATGQNQRGIQTGNQGRTSDASALTITISGNDIVVDDLPIWVNNHGGDVPAVEVLDNTVTGKEGIRLLNLDVSAGLQATGNTVTADTLGMRVDNIETGSAAPSSISNNTFTFPNGQEYDSDLDSDSEVGTSVGEQVVGMALSRLSGPQAIAFGDNAFGTPGSADDGPFYGYTLFDVQAGERTVLRQTGSAPTINGTQQGVFVANTENFSEGFGSLYALEDLVMDNFTGSSPNSSVNLHAGIFVFSTLDTPAVLDGEIRNVTVRNTGIAGGDPGGQASAGLYFGDFGSTASVRQTTSVEGATLTSNDNRGVFLRGLGARATVSQSTLTGNGDAPYTTGGNFGFSILSRISGQLAVQNSFVTGPATVSTSGSPDDNSLIQAAARASNMDPLASVTVTESALDRNGVGSYASGSGRIDASLNAWKDGGSGFVNPGKTAPISADYSPFLTTGDADGSTAGFQADPSVLTADSGSPQLQSETRIEEAAGLGGSAALRLEQSGSSYDVLSDVTLQGDLVIPGNLSFGTAVGEIQIVNAELVADPAVTSVREGPGTPVFDVQNRFVGTDGPGNDAGWRILSSPRAAATGGDLDNTLNFSTSAGSILHRWDGPSQEFVALDNTAASDLPAGEGFFLYLFDIAGRDQVDAAPSSSCTAGDACVNVTGPLDLSSALPAQSSVFGTGDLSVDIPAGGNSTATEAGYVLGVPYAQSFDLSSLTINGNPIGSEGAFRASVQAWNPQTGQFEVITEDPGSSDQLAPWQGFWILRQTGTANEAQTLTFESSGRTRGAPFIPAKTGSTPRVGRLHVDLTLDTPDGPLRSRAVLYARSGASVGDDAYDAPRIAPPTSAYVQASFATDAGQRRAQASLPYALDQTVDLPLHLEAVGTSGSATLSASAWDEVPDGWTFVLTDTQTGASIPLAPGRTTQVSLDGSSASDDAGPNGGPQGGTVAPRFVLTVSPGGVLPVELTRFTGRANGTEVVLSWTTASETNNAGFRVQQRAAGPFETVRTVPGAGTTQDATSYQVRIPDVAYGEHLFRLVQVDTDGTATPTKETTIQVRLDQPLAVSKVAPNPMSGRGQFEVAVQETQPVRVGLYDVLGRRVSVLYEDTMDGGASHLIRVPADRLSSGTYFIRIDGRSVSRTQRFTVVR